jgi:hypothetical protein
MVENNRNNEGYVNGEQKYFDELLKIPMEERARLLWNPSADWEKKRLNKEEPLPIPSMKNIAFTPPLLEYNAACGGCSESPIIKILTQMFGERMVVAVSCGCSMVWGGYTPCFPYTFAIFFFYIFLQI